LPEKTDSVIVSVVPVVTIKMTPPFPSTWEATQFEIVV